VPLLVPLDIDDDDVDLHAPECRHEGDALRARRSRAVEGCA
jgi:hypothetical protein